MKRLIGFILLVAVVMAGYLFWAERKQDQVKLYFATKDGMQLEAEYRKVKGDKIQAALAGLIAGPENVELSPTLPPGVEVLSIKVQDGLCTVNFNQMLSTNHWGGSTGEMLTIYSIVDTLAQFPGVERVQILIEGRKVETLKGHLMLDESLEPDQAVQN